MRWHVHGTDTATSRPIALSMDAPSAQAAIHAAIARNIVVLHVTRGPRLRIFAICLATACAAAVMLGAGLGVMYWREAQTREELNAAQAEQNRLVGALVESGAIVTTLQRRSTALEEAQGGAAKRLVDQLEASQRKDESLEAELTRGKVHARQLENQIADLEKRAAAIPPLRQQLADAQMNAATIYQQLAAQTKRAADLEKLLAADVGMVKTNHELAAQLELYKTQLLDQAAHAIPVTAPAPVDPPLPVPKRWALRTSFDSAIDFLAVHFDKDAITTAAGNDGGPVTSGLLPDSAATLRLSHDAEKKRLYNAVLTVSFAPDAPKPRLAENQQLLLDFIQHFAPTFKDPGPWLAETVRHLDGKDRSDRVLRIGDDYKLTVWNNRLGLYSWKIESPRIDLGD